ncbi:MAG: DUF1998 domain-containing protein, partial [Myxococcales bacterium]|nr:DUF1998 domain-containing protein [Myxococcales bacterium]
IWRINLGWRRRKESAQLGFDLDIDRGYWAANEQRKDRAPGQADPVTTNIQRVIPFVDDHRNALLFEPTDPMAADTFITLQVALKAAIQERYQLEDRELEAEPLPHAGAPQRILFYESAEGGAGVLRQLVEDPKAFPALMRLALARCHFDPDADFADLGPALDEPCEAACYDCLLSYFNQRDHRRLDRSRLRPLSGWADGTVALSPTPLTRSQHRAALDARCQSELERAWLAQVDDLGLRLPDAAQKAVPAAECTPDFVYTSPPVAVFIDGPHHDRPDQRALDARQRDALFDLGIEPLVFRFDEQSDWPTQLAASPHVFGAPLAPSPSRVEATTASEPAAEPFDADLYPPAWVDFLARLAASDWGVGPGEDVGTPGGRIAGRSVAELRPPGSRTHIHLVDANHPQAQPAHAALRAQQLAAVALRPDDPDALDRLRAALTEVDQ